MLRSCCYRSSGCARALFAKRHAALCRLPQCRHHCSRIQRSAERGLGGSRRRGGRCRPRAGRRRWRWRRCCLRRQHGRQAVQRGLRRGASDPTGLGQRSSHLGNHLVVTVPRPVLAISQGQRTDTQRRHLSVVASCGGQPYGCQLRHGAGSPSARPRWHPPWRNARRRCRP